MSCAEGHKTKLHSGRAFRKARETCVAWSQHPYLLEPSPCNDSRLNAIGANKDAILLPDLTWKRILAKVCLRKQRYPQVPWET